MRKLIKGKHADELKVEKSKNTKASQAESMRNEAPFWNEEKVFSSLPTIP